MEKLTITELREMGIESILTDVFGSVIETPYESGAEIHILLETSKDGFDIYIITDRRDADKGAYYPCDELFTDEYEMMSEVQSMFEDGMLFNTTISSDILTDDMIDDIDNETLAELVNGHSDSHEIKVDDDGYCIE
tara:strand:- start:15160 stop:15567 length:408 start_codon:yes stop_codon:yes gene_type:complete